MYFEQKIKLLNFYVFEKKQGALSGLRQFLATESPLKMMKNVFYFMLKALSFSRYISFYHDFLFM